MGNNASVRRKLEHIGAESVISGNPDVLSKCDRLILPGVGHFGRAVGELRQTGLWDWLDHEVRVRKKPTLGICLGMQLMARYSEEGRVEGFGWLEATVTRFAIADTARYKVPHIGWNEVVLRKPSLLFDGVPERSLFYFVHAYHMVCTDSEDVLGVSTYERPFVAAVCRDNVMGLQCHPEKSQDVGEIVLKNFTVL
ncbi:MAG: imidazole glycerol phosphate synthase subunit HisH [Chitinivibrionales bacterium]|nr:imidazole glycerol phosphate synthase subunit HisH [Chitinivibrionales bacterium]